MFHLSLNFLFPANKIIPNVAEVLNLKSSAYQEVLKYFCDRAVGNVNYIDPIAVNVKAARALRDLCSFESPGMALFYFPNCFSLVQ